MKRQQQRIEWRQNQTPKVDAENDGRPMPSTIRPVSRKQDSLERQWPGTSEMGRGSSQVAQIIPDPRLVRQCKMRTGPEVNHCCYVLVLLQFLEAPIPNNWVMFKRIFLHQPRHAAYNVSFMSERDVSLQIRPLQTGTSWSEWKSLQWCLIVVAWIGKPTSR